MKTQRRHELQTNVLADYIGKHLQQIKPYSRHISIGTLLVFVAIMAGLYFSNESARKRGAGWSDYLQAFGTNDANKLEEVATIHDGSAAALWARLSAGEINVAVGTGQLFNDREEAEKTLKDARKQFRAVEEDAGGNAELLERARFGLAQVHESLSEIKEAREYYGGVAESSPDSALGKVAKLRFDRLSDKSVERWYHWFERQEPAPPPELPERPDLSLPGSGMPNGLDGINLDAPLSIDPLGQVTVDPMSTDTKEPPVTVDDAGTAAPDPEESPKPDDTTAAPESADEDAGAASEVAKDAEKPKPKEPGPAEEAKPNDKPAATSEDDAKPESKDTSS